MADSLTLHRQWKLLKLLSSRRHGVDVDEMAHEMGYSIKTIRRDISLFRGVGFPISEELGDNGKKRYRLAHPSGQLDLTFNYDEALSLYLGRRFLDPLAGTLFWEACQRAFGKIRASLGSTAISYVESILGRIHATLIGASDYASKADIIDALLVGIEESRQSVIVYQSTKATEPVEYAVHPYGFVYHQGSLYLVADSIDHGEIRHFKIDRMSEAEVSNLSFERRSDFDLMKHLEGSFGVFQGSEMTRVRIRFIGWAARYVTESIWHQSQKVEARDGVTIVTFELSSTQEVKRWVMSFGCHAEVLEPEELRQEIADDLRLVLTRYESSDSSPKEENTP